MSGGSLPRAPRREIALLCALVLLPLLPFLDKAVSIDAPVFLAVARQIVASPGDPFGFQMVWDPTSPEVAVFNRNPPLLSYYLAPWLAVFGEHEVPLRVAMLPFPLAAALAFYGLARRWVGAGLAPTALLVTTPAFLVLASTFMLDVPVLACMLVALYAFVRGAEPGGERWQWVAGAAAAATGLMKYVGLSIAPLLVAGLALLYRRRGAAALRVLGPPLALWAFWGVYTAALYGAPHFWGATDLLHGKKLHADELWNQALSAPLYYGAALVFPVFLWVRGLFRSGQGTELAVLGALLGVAVVTWVLPDGDPPRRVPLASGAAALGALGFAAGFWLCAQCLRPARWRAGPEERFLALWTGGLLVFSMFLNWHVNAADALLVAPPALLLVFRSTTLRPSPRSVAWWAPCVLALSVALTAADAIQANFYRTAGRLVAAEIGDRSGARWFVGQWGLHYYLEREGFRAVLPPMYGRSDLAVGDWVSAARNISQLDVSQPMKRYAIRNVWTWEKTTWLPLRTTNPDAGAGFYSHHYGYVPFTWSTLPVEKIDLGRVERVR